MNKSAYLTVENPMAATFRYLAISIMFMFVGFLFGKLFIPASLVYIANIFVVVLVVGLLIFSLMSRKNVIPRNKRNRCQKQHKNLHNDTCVQN